MMKSLAPNDFSITTSSAHSANSSSPRNLKVTTYNIHSCVGSDWKYSVERVAQTISASQPDVVALQEVDVNHVLQKTRLWSSTHDHDQVKRLSELTNLQHHAFAPAIRCKSEGKYTEVHGEGDGEFGIGVLSRFPILDTRIITYKPFGMKSPRNAIAAKLELAGGETLWFVCTHLGCHTGAEQFQQAKELFLFTEDLRLNHSDSTTFGLIVCGDTNSPPGFKAIDAMRGLPVYRPTLLRKVLPVWALWALLEKVFACVVKGVEESPSNCPNCLTDTWDECENGIKGSGTFPALGLPGAYWATCCPPIMKLDYIMCSGHGVHVLETSILKTGDGASPGVDLVASDHRPLVAKFAISRDGNGSKSASGKGQRSADHWEKTPTWAHAYHDALLLFLLLLFATVITLIELTVT